MLLPFLIWNFMPASFFGARMFRWKRLWVLLFFPLAALVLGLAQRETATVMTDPIFNLRVFAGYTVFGLGAMSLLYLCAVILTLVVVLRQSQWGKRLFYFGGAFAILLPLLFYVGQLHTPRYFFRVCEVALIFFCTRRGRVLLDSFSWRKPVMVLCCAGCLIPMVLGVDLDQISRPKLTFSNATCFPSGDGYYPMGSYLDFLFQMKNAEEEPIDHNQMIWRAVQTAELKFEDGPVPVLWSPMFGYFMLRASLEDGVAECKPLSHWAGKSFYAETRTWMRLDPKFGQVGRSELLRTLSEPVSRDLGGIEVRRFGRGDDGWAERTRFLNRLFAGNEYRVYNVDDFSVDQLAGPRRVVLFSKKIKSLQGVLSIDHEVGKLGAFYYALLDSREISVVDDGDHVMVAVAVFPDWMSVQAF
ncbi:hypothetical protein ACFLQY_05060 [Verrucomicrobiota bacterium]